MAAGSKKRYNFKRSLAMPSRSRRGRLDVGDEVWVELTDQHFDLLSEMALIEPSGNIMQGVRMYGKIMSRTSNNFVIRLPAAEEDLVFAKHKTNKAENEVTPVYHVVVPGDDGPHIKEVIGLGLPKQVEGYHLTNEAATKEMTTLSNSAAQVLHEESTATPTNPTTNNNTTTSSATAASGTVPTTTAVEVSATVPTTTAVQVSATVPTTTEVQVSETQTTAAAASATLPTTTTVQPSVTHTATNVVVPRRRGRRRLSAARRRRHRRRDDDDVPDFVDLSDTDISDSSDTEDDDDDDVSGDDGAGSVDTDDAEPNDFMTDEEGEQQSDHESEVVLTWKKPKTWQQDREGHPLIAELGETEWKVPVDRGSVQTQDTGPQQDPRFRKKVRDKADYLNLFLDALPILQFWQRIVQKQSRIYGKSKVNMHNK